MKEITGWRRVCGFIGFAGVAAICGLGVARDYRTSELLAPINAGTHSGLRLADSLEVARRVASRFQYIERHGPVGTLAQGPFRTDAEDLVTGGDCGQAAQALAAAFMSSGRAFRIIQVNVDDAGANHIMLETPDDGGRWVLIDPLTGSGISKPLDDRLIGIDEIRALPPGDRAWLAQEYRNGDWSLFAPYRRTNWAKAGPLAGILRAVAGDSRMSEVSVRAMMLESARHVGKCAGIVILVLAVFGMFSLRAPRMANS